MSDKEFFIGRTAAATPENVFYDPDDFTTHGVIVGMTGSGKTGLLIGLLEEAALKGLPAIIIDPKGDLTNLLLHFPDLLPASFEPWIDPEAARRENMTVPQLAEKTAANWQKGLAGYELGHDQLLALKNAVDYVVYTPGSNTGEPVNLLASFAPPAGLTWAEHREILRERVSSTVTALLSLIGLKDIDPLRSREHILVSNIIETAWSKGAALDLTELIMQVQTPPFERLGAFPVDNFFPEKDRFELAILLNNFLASPSFQSWTEGQSLDAQAFFYTPSGKPRFSIFYLAHLDETERMFFVTLLLAAVESWMRAQRGSPGLRALVAFDEIVGYLPPIANPPSRPVLLRLLKQARAFGVGLLLATQNPVDIDYKGLSNAGTWFVGRLQTDQDKGRLLDGLQSIEGGVDRPTYEKIISALKPRSFLLHNVHHRGTSPIFSTRWCLNYLAGPLARVQLPALKLLGSAPDEAPAANSYASVPSQPTVAAAVAQATPAAQVAVQAAAPAAEGPLGGATRTPPSPPAGTKVLYLSPEMSLSQALGRISTSMAGPVQPQGLLYVPTLLFQADVHYYNRKYNLDFSKRVSSLLTEMNGVRADWDKFQREPIDPARVDNQPLPDARFLSLPSWLSGSKNAAALEKEFLDWVYRTAGLTLFAHDGLKIYSSPDDTQVTFRKKCEEAARLQLRDQQAKLDSTFNTRLTTLKRKIEKQQSMVDKYENEVSRRRMEELGSAAELAISLFSKRKKSISSSLSKGRMTSQAKENLEAANDLLKSLQEEMTALQSEKDAAAARLQDQWAQTVGDFTEVTINPLRKDIYIELSGLAWMPVYVVQAEGKTFQAPAV